MPPPEPTNYTHEFTATHFLTNPQLYCRPHHKLLSTLSRTIRTHISLIDPDPSDTTLTTLYRHLTIRTSLTSLLPLPQSISAHTHAELRRKRIHEVNKVIELTVQKAILAALTLDRAGFTHDELHQLMRDTLACGMTEGSFCRAHVAEIALSCSENRSGKGQGAASGSGKGSGSGSTDGSGMKIHGFCRFSAETATILLARLALNLLYEPETEPEGEVEAEAEARAEIEGENAGGETMVERQRAEVGYVTSSGWRAINRG